MISSRNVWQVGSDIAVGDLNNAVLHVFQVHKRDIVNNIQVFQQYGTYEAIKITAGDKSIHIC